MCLTFVVGSFGRFQKRDTKAKLSDVNGSSAFLIVCLKYNALILIFDYIAKLTPRILFYFVLFFACFTLKKMINNIEN